MLHKRVGTTSSFTEAGKGKICKGPADWDDGPNATPSDAACKAHCLKGEHSHHHGPPPPPPHPSGPIELTINTDAVTHQISPLAMGCHSDSGYAHQARGFYSQLIVGSDFTALSLTLFVCPYIYPVLR